MSGTIIITLIIDQLCLLNAVNLSPNIYILDDFKKCTRKRRNDRADPRTNCERCELNAVVINDVTYDVSTAIITIAVVMWNGFAGVASVADAMWNAPLV